MILFDFKCTRCNHVHERLVKSDTRDTECPICGYVAVRIISPVRCKLDPISGDFPGATIAWEKRHVNGAKTKS